MVLCDGIPWVEFYSLFQVHDRHLLFAEFFLDDRQVEEGFIEIRRLKINNILVSNTGGPYDGKRYSAAVSGLLERSLPDGGLQVQKVKQLYLFGAELLGSLFTTMFIGFGSFSIAAALLLIFLIFVMLAAERKQEMGMARAVGTKRRHLVQMFVFEGTAYDLVAAAVGALLGAAVGLVAVGFWPEALKLCQASGTFG